MFASSALIVALAVISGGEIKVVRQDADVVVQPAAAELFVDDEVTRETSRRSERETAKVKLAVEENTATPLRPQPISNASVLGGEPVQQEAAEPCTDDCFCDACCGGPAHVGPWGWDKRFYPSPCFSPGDMPLHIPYIAEPKNYYYFRPYNWFHIRDHQQEVLLYGGDPRHPYDNKIFDEIYLRFEEALGEE